MLCGTKGNLFKVLEYLCVISSPLTNKTKGEKSWLSGSFHKQQHDKKFMASQHQETEFCCPLEKQKARQHYATGRKPPHLPAQDGGEAGYACGLRVDWQDSELRAEALAW